MRIYKYLILLLIVSCNLNNENNKEIKHIKDKVAKFAISELMGQPFKTIKVDKSEGDKFSLSYVRQSDSKLFNYDVTVVNGKVVWRVKNGRWRNSKYDEKINYFDSNDTLALKITDFDKSGRVIKFK
jgi:outer membrane lipoprotein-sorting protein